MPCFIMKARTLDNDWYPFTIADVPTCFSETEFALMHKPNSPRLLLNTIRKGDVDTGLYEGDVIQMNGERWLVCYQRGFYIINEQYITKHLYNLDEFEVIGDYIECEFPIPILMRTKYLFKFKDTIFRLEDIMGCYDEHTLILRSLSQPVPVNLIKQECGITYNGKKVYLGDTYDNKVTELHWGRIVLSDNGQLTDITTGGNLDGCFS